MKRAPEPRKSAVALRFERESDDAPSLVAKGKGELAEQILAFARANDVPVREDSDLVQLLAACEVGEEIPADLYAAVAELLTYLYRLNAELGAVRDAGTDG